MATELVTVGEVKKVLENYQDDLKLYLGRQIIFSPQVSDEQPVTPMTAQTLRFFETQKKIGTAWEWPAGLLVGLLAHHKLIETGGRSAKPVEETS